MQYRFPYVTQTSTTWDISLSASLVFFLLITAPQFSYGEITKLSSNALPNLALGRPTNQSSQLWNYRCGITHFNVTRIPSSLVSFPSSKLAVDGNAETCSFTDRVTEYQRWWSVELPPKIKGYEPLISRGGDNKSIGFTSGRAVNKVAVTITPGDYQKFTVFIVGKLGKIPLRYLDNKSALKSPIIFIFLAIARYILFSRQSVEISNAQKISDRGFRGKTNFVPCNSFEGQVKAGVKVWITCETRVVRGFKVMIDGNA